MLEFQIIFLIGFFDLHFPESFAAFHFIDGINVKETTNLRN